MFAADSKGNYQSVALALPDSIPARRFIRARGGMVSPPAPPVTVKSGGPHEHEHPADSRQ